MKKKIKEADGKGEGRKKEEARRESQGMERVAKRKITKKKKLFLETRLFYGRKKRGVRKTFHSSLYMCQCIKHYSIHNCLQSYKQIFKMYTYVHPVVKTPHFHFRRCEFDPWSVNRG